FDYATGVLALLSNEPNADVSDGYDPKKYATVAIADPNLAPYGVAAQSGLGGRDDRRLRFPGILSSTNIPISRQLSLRFLPRLTRWGLWQCQQSVPTAVIRRKEQAR